MAYKGQDDFFQLTPEDRYARVVYSALEGLQLAIDAEQLLEKVELLEALLWPAILDPASKYRVSAGSIQSTNAFAIAKAKLKLLMEEAYRVGLLSSPPDVVQTDPKPGEEKHPEKAVKKKK